MPGPIKGAARVRRERFREILERNAVTIPASIVAPVSARLASGGLDQAPWRK